MRRALLDSEDFQPAWREIAALARDHLKRMRQTLSGHAEMIADCRDVIGRSRALLDQAAQQGGGTAHVQARR
jgi:ABC-type transporter Mla subunit MlaD